MEVLHKYPAETLRKRVLQASHAPYYIPERSCVYLGAPAPCCAQIREKVIHRARKYHGTTPLNLSGNVLSSLRSHQTPTGASLLSVRAMDALPLLVPRSQRSGIRSFFLVF